MKAPTATPSRYHRWLVTCFVVVAAAAIGIVGWLIAQWALQKYAGIQPSTTPTGHSAETPEVRVETLAHGLKNPWDVDFLPDGQLLFTQRQGTLSVLRDDKPQVLLQVADVKAGGEGGLLGLAVDSKFRQNRFIYLCFNSTLADIRVARFVVNKAVTGLENRVDIVTGLPANTGGRHSGCQVAFGPDDHLWIGTGDSAQGGKSPQTPQDPKSLGGKILRVDRDGKGLGDNLAAPFDNRIYSFGHRNTQGLAFLPTAENGVIGFSAEHGSTIDDEINQLHKGNFGWDPDVGYTEIGVPMTDRQKFPDAIEPIWKSGTPTQAPSGLAVISGPQWKAWDGALAMSMLKAKHLKILLRNNRGTIVKEEQILSDKGRLRASVQGSDGNLYITTDNGVNDQIIRLVPVKS